MGHFFSFKTVQTNLSISLDALTYYYAVEYDWDFGDGNMLLNTTAMVNHTWMEAGYYNLTVMAVHPFGDKLFWVCFTF